MKFPNNAFDIQDFAFQLKAYRSSIVLFCNIFFPQEKHKQLRIALKEKEVKEKERREQIEKQKQREIEERKRWAEFEAFI